MLSSRSKKAKSYICILAALYFAVSDFPHASIAQDINAQPDPDLHPAINPTPAANNSAPIDAKQPVNRDYDEHIKCVGRLKGANPPLATTGAQDTGNRAILEKHYPGLSGPSSAVGEYNVQEIDISRPKLQSLISVNDYLSPFTLDAITSSAINLSRALLIGLENNLDLAISRTNTKQYQNAYYSSLGRFLPDPTLGFRDFFSKGSVGLPFNLASLAASPTISSFGNSSGRESTVRIHHPFMFMNAGGEYYAYRGGSVLFGALQARSNYRAATHQEHATLSDTLMTVTRNYYNLVLAEALLKIRIDAARTSEEQLRRNQDRFHSGLATNLDVLQSKTQLSRDKQALVDQQTNRRSAAISLADSLNLTFAQDLMPVDLAVKKMRLIDPRLDITKLLRIAIDNRPELKQYEELRLAAKKAIIVAAANLQPTVALTGNAYGIGPPNNLRALGVFAINVNWRLRGLGIVDSMNTNQARWQARQVMLQAQKELQTVCNQMRNAYIASLDKERNLEESTNEVKSSFEELRLAELRKSSGLGINLDVITAQRDYTQARVDQAQSLIDFNIAQAQLLHDLGMISTEALTSGKLLGESR